nr:anthranilate synthase component I family protein [Bacillus mediterraneensis]
MGKYNIYHEKVVYDAERFFQSYCHIAKNYHEHVLLESGRGGRYSIAAFGPAAVLKGKEGVLTVDGLPLEQDLPSAPKSMLQSIKKWMDRYTVEEVPGLPDFQGGAIGYIGYDYARHIEELPTLAEDDLQLPDVLLFVFHEVFVYDHIEEKLVLMVLYPDGEKTAAIEAANIWREKWEALYPAMEKKCTASNSFDDSLEVSMTEKEFIDAVHRIQAYISSGDVFQVNLSVRQSRPLVADAIEVYRELRRLNPSPYMAFIQTEDYQIVSGSPELLVKKKRNIVSTRPIAGTRSRGRDEAEDTRLAAELISNEKERAEHVMLVDLERNDLGRVSRYGTVEVDEFMVIEKYSHVMHIVSNVKGELAEGKSWPDIIHAAFPGGTITGAPKVRTMEIIEELEPVRRGIYTGSIGWIGYNGDMEMNIVIRTMLCMDGKAHVQAGAGIVIDSIAVNEYLESLKKGKALWSAKNAAEREGGTQ